MADLDTLMAAIGYTFAQLEHLECALTHRSFVHEAPTAGIKHNERLEFLGDAVVDLAIAQCLMEALPDEREGRLSRLRAMIVSEAAMADVALALGLGNHLRLGRGEEQCGGRQKPSLLADSFEAVIGAVYLDGGFEVAYLVVTQLLGEVVAAAISGRIDPDYKTRLQEHAQATTRVTPRYVITAVRGPDHAKVFEVGVFVGDREVARGEGGSKKDAEQQAACLALKQLSE